MTARRPPLPPPLPASLAEIARLVGEAAAVKLARAHGGEKIEFPPDPTPRHRVVRLIGLAAARRLGEVWMGDRVPIPHAFARLRWEDARRLRRAGHPVLSIARRLHCSASFVARATSDIVPPARRRTAPARAAAPLPLFEWRR